MGIIEDSLVQPLTFVRHSLILAYARNWVIIDNSESKWLIH